MSTNDFLNKLIKKENLTKKEARELAVEIFNKKTPQTSIAGILTALKMKGETVEEIMGFVEILREGMKEIKYKGNIIDTCGTGGDGKKTFNISTLTAIITAASGVGVAKHGNRSASGMVGSADVLEALGVNINISEDGVTDLMNKTKIVFLFAPNFHPLMKIVGPVRKELKIRTIFNLVGPLLNPMGVKRQVIGVSDIETFEKMSGIVKKLPYEHVLICHSADGIDEVSIYAKTKVFEIRAGKIKKFEIDPFSYGMEGKNIRDIQVNDVFDSKEKILQVLEGVDGDMRNIAVLNSAAALYVCGKYKDIGEGVKEAERVIDSGKAMETLNKLIVVSNEKYD